MIELLKKELAPLLKFKGIVKAVWLYGSSVYSDNPHDLDILILIDDSKDVSELELLRLNAVRNEINGKKLKDAVIHIQPSQPLSNFWHLLVSSEPWMHTSIIHMHVIYDPDNFLKEIKYFIDKKTIYNVGEKSERLLERAVDYILKNRSLYIDAIKVLKDIAVEAAQIVLMFDSKMFFEPEKIIDYLDRNYAGKLGYTLGTFREIVDLYNKAEMGYLSVFSGENIDYYTGEVKKFIEKVQEIIKEKKNA